MVYLDNSATTGIKPQAVIDAVNDAMKNLSANPGRSGHKLSMRTAEIVYKCRSKASELFSADGEQNVVFTQNCTMSLNCVIKGVLSKGDHVIISSFEHNSVVRPLELLHSRGLIEYDQAEVIIGDSDATFRSFERLIKNNTRMIICTHASNVTGLIMPIEKLGELCRNKKILFTVDAAQSAGVLPINVKKMNIDYLCVAPHKGLYAPMGTGILIASNPIKNTIIEGGTGSDSLNILQPSGMPEMLESGTINVPGICGIIAGIDYVSKKGIDNIYNGELRLIQMAYNSLAGMTNVNLYTPYPETGEYAPVLSFNIRDRNSADVAAYLDERNIFVRAGLHCAPSAHKRLGTIDSGTVRVSTGIFNTISDMVEFVNAVKVLQ